MKTLISTLAIVATLGVSTAHALDIGVEGVQFDEGLTLLNPDLVLDSDVIVEVVYEEDLQAQLQDADDALLAATNAKYAEPAFHTQLSLLETMRDLRDSGVSEVGAEYNVYRASYKSAVGVGMWDSLPSGLGFDGELVRIEALQTAVDEAQAAYDAIAAQL